MFESIIIRRPTNTTNNYDAGIVAESLFYYQNVHLILDHGALAGLLQSIGVENLLRLIDDGFATATFVRDTLGTQTDNSHFVPAHRFIEFHFMGTPQKPKLSREDRIYEIFERAIGPGWKTKRLAKRFASKIPIRPLSEGSGHQSGVPGLAHDDLLQRDFVRKVAGIALKNWVPEYAPPDGWEFSIARGKEDFVVLTNLDFAAINAKFQEKTGRPEDILTCAHLVGPVLDARADMFLAAKHMSEMVTDITTSQIIQLRFSDLLMKRDRNLREIELFQEVTLQNSRAIRDAVNTGKLPFGEFLDLLKTSHRFRRWLKEANPDKKLLEEYNEAITKGTWAERLPVRIARFALFTGVGTLLDATYGIAAGAAVGAADQFLLGKLFRGWRPNQFIQNRLRPSVQAD
jgi:hypothetical protein